MFPSNSERPTFHHRAAFRGRENLLSWRSIIPVLRIKPRPPFNFNLSAGVFSDDLFDGESLCLVIRLDKKIVLACMKSTGSVEEPDLTVDLE